MALWRNNIQVAWFKRLHNSTTPSFITVGVLLKLLFSTIISAQWPFLSPKLSRLTPVHRHRNRASVGGDFFMHMHAWEST